MTNSVVQECLTTAQKDLSGPENATLEARSMERVSGTHTLKITSVTSELRGLERP